jgi:hypothetical protein
MLFLSFPCTDILYRGSMGWITLFRTGFNRPRYLLQNNKTDAQFSDAWLSLVSSGSEFVLSCAITTRVAG